MPTPTPGTYFRDPCRARDQTTMRWISLLLYLASLALAVKHQDFKTCAQSSFCARNRALADRATIPESQWQRQYSVDGSSIRVTGGVLTASVVKKVPIAGTDAYNPIQFSLTITFLKNGAVRYVIDEKRRQTGSIHLRGQGEGKVNKRRYNEAAKWAVVGGLEVDQSVEVLKWKKMTKIKFGPGRSYEMRLYHENLETKFERNGAVHVVLNERSFLNMEHWRPKEENPSPKEEEETESKDDLEQQEGMWEETFGGRTDSKPRGPESIGLDITFPGYSHVYGIPEHASSLALKTTRGEEGGYSEPYRLYNADVFEYEIDNPMTLYGSIPFMQAHKKQSDVGVFWLNSAETWIDITKEKMAKTTFGAQESTQTHWMSESGIMDVFVFLGPNASSLFRTFGELVGYTMLPQQFALGYHQCRWNYVSEDDVKDVDRQFDESRIPYDVIWLDIEYTDNRKYFTWDPATFGHPEDMLDHLDAKKRKLVAIIDPHIKNEAGFWVYDELVKNDFAMKDASGKTYDGWCWPGNSIWPDFFNPSALSWWKSAFKFDRFKGSKENLHLWNDMNEPSVFNGPEVTAPKDNLHYHGWEHRDIHNINGLTFHNATALAIMERTEEAQRPFVLSRAFFAGSQRSAAIWTGDNQANWEHLKASIPMLLSIGISGLTFSGADVGGFFGNPSNELLVRWYQAGAFYPFFRAHAHIDSKRREPYLIGDPWTAIIRDAIELRYSLLPTYYTSIRRSSVDGMPLLRPQYVQYPNDESAFSMEDQFYVGDSGLLVKPVTDEGSTSATVYLADKEVYYDYWTHQSIHGPGHKTIDAPLDKIPLLIQGGSVLSRKDRVRRSSTLMHHDPYTLVVAVGSHGTARGELYIDDGQTFAYQNGEYIYRSFQFSAANSTLWSTSLHPSSNDAASMDFGQVRIEKVIVLGHDKSLKKEALVKQGGKSWTVSVMASVLSGNKVKTVRNPNVVVGEDWTIELV